MEIMEWIELLPENCPPEEAYPPNNMAVFRLVESCPPSEVDFQSTKQRSPNRISDECILKSCSVFSSFEACDKVRKTFRDFRNMRIVRIVLPPESGLIMQTVTKPSHYSWWRSADFDPIKNCSEVD